MGPFDLEREASSARVPRLLSANFGQLRPLYFAQSLSLIISIAFRLIAVRTFKLIMSGTPSGAGGFLSRLDDASTTLRAERKDITPIKAKSEGVGRQTSKDSSSPMPALDQHARPDITADSKYKSEGARELYTADEKDACKGVNENLVPKLEKTLQQPESLSAGADNSGSGQKGKSESESDSEGDQDLVSLCNEYIFDLFDANMLEDYHTVANFETRALDAFVDPFSEEISFEQERLHNEFMELFEKLIEKFLREKNVPKEEFYSQVQEHVHRDVTKSKRDEAKKRTADEVVDVIYCYTDLRLWCGEMRKRAVMQLQHNEYLRQKTRGAGLGAEVPAARKTQLQEVAEAHGVSTPLVRQNSPSTSHRFDVT